MKIRKIFSLFMMVCALGFYTKPSGAVTVGQTVQANALAIQPNGQVVMCGNAIAGQISQIFVCRVNTDGSYDTSFGTAGNGVVLTTVPNATNQYAYAIALQSNGQIIVAGAAIISGISSALFMRYNLDGSLDTTFGGTGQLLVNIGTAATIQNIVIQSDGNIVGSGNALLDQMYPLVVRVTTQGTLDTSFGTTGIVTSAIGLPLPIMYGVGLLSNEEIVVAGTTNNSILILKYTTSGILDTTFGTNGVLVQALPQPGCAYNVAVQANDQLLITGAMNSQAFLARLDTDGSYDTTFGTNGIVTLSGGNLTIGFCVLEQSDGNILMSGSMGGFAMVARYESTGVLDTTFGNGGVERLVEGIDDSIAFDIALESDNTIMAAGMLCKGALLYSLNTDGSLNTTFSGDGYNNDPSGDPCRLTT